MGTEEQIAAGMRRQLALRSERLAAGEEHLGWKVGLNAPALMDRLGLESFVVGFMTSASLLHPGAKCSLQGATAPAAEPEIALRVGHDLGITAVGAAIEIVDIDRGFDDLEEIVATDIFHRGVRLGAAFAQPGDADGGTLRLNGEETAVETPSARALDETLQTVRRRVEEAGESLQPGDIVIAGALLPAVPVAPGDKLELDLRALGRLELAFS